MIPNEPFETLITNNNSLEEFNKAIRSINSFYREQII